MPCLPYLSAASEDPSSLTPNRCAWTHHDPEARGWQEAGAPLGLLASCPSTSERPAGRIYMHLGRRRTPGFPERKLGLIPLKAETACHLLDRVTRRATVTCPGLTEVKEKASALPRR